MGIGSQGGVELARDDDHVYAIVSSQGGRAASLKQVRKDDGNTSTLAHLPSSAQDLQADGENLYWKTLVT